MTEKKTSSRGKKAGSANSSKTKPAAETKTVAVKTAPQKGSRREETSAKSASPATSRATSAKPQLSSEELMRMIAEQAYYLAEKRGFNGGDPVADWLAAEQKVKTQFAA